MTYMGTDEHSLTLQKEAREVLNLLMVPHGTLSTDEMLRPWAAFAWVD